jgi:hypothetical protein
MPRFACIISFWAALILGPASFAQSSPANITVVSVFTMARELAETEPAPLVRTLLRLAVARSINKAGQEAAFGSYVADAFDAIKRATPASIQRDPNWQKNRELSVEANRLFLAGDEEGAKQRLRQCEFIPHWDFCYNSEDFLQIQFLKWELLAGDLPAALHRFRVTDWKFMEPAMALLVAQAHIVAGRQSEIPELLAEVNNRFRDAAERGALGTGAALRNLVNADDIATAMQNALSRPTLSERVGGLTIIAEGLAHLPGPPDEDLSRF